MSIQILELCADKQFYALVCGLLLGVPVKTWLFRGPEKIEVVEWWFRGLEIAFSAPYLKPGRYGDHPELGPFLEIRAATPQDARDGRQPLWVFEFPRARTLDDRVFKVRAIAWGLYWPSRKGTLSITQGSGMRNRNRFCCPSSDFQLNACFCYMGHRCGCTTS